MKYVSGFPFAALLLALASSGCSHVIDIRGDLPTAKALAQVKPGMTEEEVQALLGTPSSTMTYGEDVWHYISMQTETVSFLTPEETSRKVVSVYFSKDGKVTKVTTLGLADGQPFQSVDRETPTAGKDASMLQQLFGNVGRFSKTGKVD